LKEGDNKGKKTVESEGEMKSLFNTMADGGSLVDRKSYKGIAVSLADGTQIGYRTESKSTGSTIDIQYPGSKTQYKVHVGEK